MKTNCGGCASRRQAIKRWWARLFANPKPPEQWMPDGVPVALELANALKQHCWAHGIAGTFAGVTVPPAPTEHEHA